MMNDYGWQNSMMVGYGGYWVAIAIAVLVVGVVIWLARKGGK